MPPIEVLATTDGSPRSEAVIPHAARLVQALDGELMLLRMLSPVLDCASEGVRIVAERWSEELAATLARVKATGRGAVEVRRHGEDVHEAILRVVSEQNVDIVAMSSRGSGSVRHALLGSVALSVLGTTPVPLFLAGERIERPVARGKYHIVVTTDGSDDSARAVEAVVPLSTYESVRVTLLRIHVPRLGDRGDAVEAAVAADTLNQLRERFPSPRTVRTVVRTIVGLGGVDTAILNAASELGASAIAISTHGHSAKYHVFMGSTALGVLRQSTLPCWSSEVLLQQGADPDHAGCRRLARSSG